MEKRIGNLSVFPAAPIGIQRMGAPHSASRNLEADAAVLKPRSIRKIIAALWPSLSPTAPQDSGTKKIEDFFPDHQEQSSNIIIG